MQRKIFYQNGKPILATRGDGFFETAGTLQQVIAEGRRQQQDLAQWLQAAEPSMAVESLAVPAEAPVAQAIAEPEAAILAESVEPLPPAVEPAPPGRPRQRRKRTAVAEPWAADAAVEVQENLPGSLSVGTDALPVQPRPAVRAASRTSGKRWLVAGAERRGRADKHWSTRHR